MNENNVNKKVVPYWYAIIGSRDFPNKQLVDSFVWSLPNNNGIISGGAPGPDSWAEEVANKKKMSFFRLRPNWNPQGKKGVLDKMAGFTRNKDIIEFADEVVAFHYNGSNGTQDGIDYAKKLGKKVIVFDSNGNSQTF